MPMKPIAAGAEAGGATRTRSRCWPPAAAEPSLATEVTPVLLREAIAPHIAAAAEGRTIDLAPVTAAFGRLQAPASSWWSRAWGDSACRWASGSTRSISAKALGLPVVLVVGCAWAASTMRCSRCRRSRPPGCRSQGWVANEDRASMPVREENVEALRARIHAPLLGVLPYMEPRGSRAASRTPSIRPPLAAAK
jgi:dethiobiotin synthetase